MNGTAGPSFDWFDWQQPLPTSDPFVDWPSPMAEPPIPEPYIPPIPYAMPSLPPQVTPVPPAALPVISDQWFDWEAPFYEAPLDTLPLSPAGLPYIPDTELAPMLQPPSVSVSGLGPDVTPPGGFGPYFEELTKTTGPLEVIGEIWDGAVDVVGDVVTAAADFVWDIGTHIFEHLDVSASVKGGVTPQIKSGVYATPKVYGERTSMGEYVVIDRQSHVTGLTTPTLGAGAGLGDFLGLGGVSPNVLLIGGGVVLLYLATRK